MIFFSNHIVIRMPRKTKSNVNVSVEAGANAQPAYEHEIDQVLEMPKLKDKLMKKEKLF